MIKSPKWHTYFIDTILTDDDKWSRGFSCGYAKLIESNAGIFQIIYNRLRAKARRGGAQKRRCLLVLKNTVSDKLNYYQDWTNIYNLAIFTDKELYQCPCKTVLPQSHYGSSVTLVQNIDRGSVWCCSQKKSSLHGVHAMSLVNNTQLHLGDSFHLRWKLSFVEGPQSNRTFLPFVFYILLYFPHYDIYFCSVFHGI